MTSSHTTETGKVDVAMLGSRLHYAVPKLLHGADRLGTLYTDSYSIRFAGLSAILSSLPFVRSAAPVSRWLSRGDRELGTNHVCSFDLFGIEYALRRRRVKTYS